MEEHTREREGNLEQTFLLFLIFPFSCLQREDDQEYETYKMLMHTIRKKYQSEMLLSDTLYSANTLYMAAWNTKMWLPVVQKAKKKNLKPLIWIISVTHFD